MMHIGLKCGLLLNNHTSLGRLGSAALVGSQSRRRTTPIQSSKTTSGRCAGQTWCVKTLGPRACLCIRKLCPSHGSTAPVPLWKVLEPEATFFNSLFTSIIKPCYFQEFVFRNVGFGNSLDCNLKVFVNWATGSSDRASSSDNYNTRVQKDIQSALLNFQCSAAGASSLSFQNDWEVITSTKIIMA